MTNCPAMLSRQEAYEVAIQFWCPSPGLSLYLQLNPSRKTDAWVALTSEELDDSEVLATVAELLARISAGEPFWRDR